MSDYEDTADGDEPTMIDDDLSGDPSTLNIVGTEEAQARFYAALASAQTEIHDPDKKATGKIGKGGAETFKYADLQTVLEAVRPALSKNGIAILQPFHGMRGGGIVSTILAGHGAVLRSDIQVPRFGSDEIKDLGTYLTYIKRYAIQSIVGVAGEADSDDLARRTGPRGSAQPPSPPRQAPQQAPRGIAQPSAPAQRQAAKEAQRQAVQPPAKRPSEPPPDPKAEQKAKEEADRQAWLDREAARDAQRIADLNARRAAEDEAAAAKALAEAEAADQAENTAADAAQEATLGPVTAETRERIKKFGQLRQPDMAKAITLINQFAKEATGQEALVKNPQTGKHGWNPNFTEADGLATLDALEEAFQAERRGRPTDRR